MNRRGFIGALGAVLAAAAAPQVFLPTAPVKWKRIERGIWVPNPEYVTAKYEIFFVDQPAMFDETILKDRSYLIGPTGSYHGPDWNRFPMRFKNADDFNRLEPVYPFIRV